MNREQIKEILKDVRSGIKKLKFEKSENEIIFLEETIKFDLEIISTELDFVIGKHKDKTA